ncbi:hypothetical protein [Cytobacillus solani]|uniref:DUF4871 domain-containing protein n=1 Tax=Cytobacillus solani TaxID=1637975 RepID=A0A0Q3T2L0_9BACI|nr:hypothetical protein [Cytobacillus solani]KOP78201.1 hypothetical protein AMS60_18725 [Bacillus sp. FJAT-21945]KQL17701.1 hypothetical protein AN957_03125 [Cytobacillus solani]
MKRSLFIGAITLGLLIGCSNEGSKDIEENEQDTIASSEKSTEELKTWNVTTQNSIQIKNENVDLLGEIGDYVLRSDVFRIETEGLYTWYLWTQDQNKEDLIGKKVSIKGISEKNKGEEMHLSDGEIQELSEDEILSLPDSDRMVKFEAKITPLREGRWKLKTYLENNLLGTTVISVQAK